MVWVGIPVDAEINFQVPHKAKKKMSIRETFDLIKKNFARLNYS